jgi:hypothetical protein
VRAVVIAAALAVSVGLACGSGAKPVVQPDEHPPLPPASGTPIGYLVDDSTELGLRDDQLTQLKAIDEDLASKLAVLDGELRGTGPARPASGQSGARHRGGGRRGGGRRGGASNPSGGASPGAAGGSGSAAGSGAPPRGVSAATANRVTEERAADVRSAIERALALLDAPQQQIARRVLTDHGVDLDAGRPQGKSEAGEQSGESGEPGEPDDPEPGSGSGSP